MKLGVKHANQTPIVRADFSGGLNTSSTTDSIAENQLANAVNVEIDSANGRLKTVAGTVDVLNFADIFAAAYDEINEKLLLVTTNKEIYAADLELVTLDSPNATSVYIRAGRVLNRRFGIHTRPQRSAKYPNNEQLRRHETD